MSTENHETRIAELEKTVAKMTQANAALTATLLGVQHAQGLTLQMNIWNHLHSNVILQFIAENLPPEHAKIKESILASIARSDSKNDQILASLHEAMKNFPPLPPPPPAPPEG